MYVRRYPGYPQGIHVIGIASCDAVARPEEGTDCPCVPLAVQGMYADAVRIVVVVDWVMMLGSMIPTMARASS